MAKKMKLDTAKFKQFAVEKGEKVGLGVAAALMIVLVGYGLIVGLGASSPAAQIKEEAKQLDQRIRNAPVKPPEGGKEEGPLGEWSKLNDLNKYASVGGWFDGGAAGDTKRQNPTVLPVGDVVSADQVIKNGKVVYLPGGVLMLDRVKDEILTVKPAGGGSAALPGVPVQRNSAPTGDESFGHDLHPTRMIVVTTTFPYLDQLEVIRKALRIGSRDELLKAPEGPPRFLGLVVYRVEVGDKNQQPTKIYETDDKGHVVAMGVETKKLLTTAEYDDAVTKGVAEYIVPGLVTPLPKFMNGPGYPKLILDGIQVKEGEASGTPPPMRAKTPPGGRQPTLPGGGRQPGLLQGIGGNRMTDDSGPTLAPDGKISITKLRDKNALLANKLEGNVNVFDPNVPAWPEESDDAAKKLPDFIIPKLTTPMKTGKGQDKEDKIPEKILVRFFDADVQPGKTYQYSIEVRMLNPNYGKKGLVAFDRLAEEKELFSPPAYTPPITLPREYFVYAYDLPSKQIDKDSKVKGPRGTETDGISKDKTAIQIHEWVGSASEGAERYMVADWIVAERLLIQRGEKLERKAVEIELPKWNKFKGTQGDFDLATPGGAARGKAVRTRQFATVDFEPQDKSSVSVLVDFFGGRQPTEDTSTELLILQPDGRLVARSSREDTDRSTEAGRVREERFEEWRARIKGLRPTRDNQRPPGPP